MDKKLLKKLSEALESSNLMIVEKSNEKPSKVDTEYEKQKKLMNEINEKVSEWNEELEMWGLKFYKTFIKDFRKETFPTNKKWDTPSICLPFLHEADIIIDSNDYPDMTLIKNRYNGEHNITIKVKKETVPVPPPINIY